MDIQVCSVVKRTCTFAEDPVLNVYSHETCGQSSIPPLPRLGCNKEPLIRIVIWLLSFNCTTHGSQYSTSIPAFHQFASGNASCSGCHWGLHCSIILVPYNTALDLWSGQDSHAERNFPCESGHSPSCILFRGVIYFRTGAERGNKCRSVIPAKNKGKWSVCVGNDNAPYHIERYCWTNLRIWWSYGLSSNQISSTRKGDSKCTLRCSVQASSIGVPWYSFSIPIPPVSHNCAYSTCGQWR